MARRGQRGCSVRLTKQGTIQPEPRQASLLEEMHGNCWRSGFQRGADSRVGEVGGHQRDRNRTAGALAHPRHVGELQVEEAETVEHRYQGLHGPPEAGASAAGDHQGCDLPFAQRSLAAL